MGAQTCSASSTLAYTDASPPRRAGASGARGGSGAFSDRMRLGFGVASAGLAGGLLLGATAQPAHLEEVLPTTSNQKWTSYPVLRVTISPENYMLLS